MRMTFKILYHCPHTDSSWKVVSDGLMSGFSQASVSVDLQPMGVKSDYDQLLWGQPHLWRPFEDTLTTTGYTINEGQSLPADRREAYLEKCKHLDYLVFPSRAAGQAFLESPLDTPHSIVPLAVSDSLDFISRDFTIKPFVFLHYGVVQPRKGTDILLEAFTKAFDQGENVTLIIHHWTGWMDWFNHYRQQYTDPRILWLIGQPNRSITSVLSKVHCLVHPSLAEGFGLTVFEALRTGLPVIASRTSAMLEYFTSEFLEFIEMSEEYIPCVDILFLDTGGYFRKPDIDSLVTKLRYAYTHPLEMAEKAKRGHHYTKQFTWRETARKLVACIVEARRIKGV